MNAKEVKRLIENYGFRIEDVFPYDDEGEWFTVRFVNSDMTRFAVETMPQDEVEIVMYFIDKKFIVVTEQPTG